MSYTFPHQGTTLQTYTTTTEQFHTRQINFWLYSNIKLSFPGKTSSQGDHICSTCAPQVSVWSLSRLALWLLLQSTGVPQKVNCDSSSCIRVNGNLSDFIFHSGVRQGRVLAPDSFNSVIDWILDGTVPNTVPGISVSPDCFTDLDYANDVALLGELLIHWCQL